MAKSDYKYQFVSPPPDDVICPLCLDIVEEPHQFTCCGHHICRKCGDKLKQQDATPQCPMCQNNEYGTGHDKYFERNILNKLPIWCTEGCGQEVELGQLKNHLTQCPYVQEDCPYRCGQQYQRQYIEEHKEKCPKRPFVCDYCKYQSTYEVIVNEHYPVCDKYPIICPNECSGDEIERGMLQDHLDKCPFQVVYCPYRCGQQYQRRHIEEHKEKCPKCPFVCDYCEYQSTYEVIVNEHYPVCDKYPIICPNECSENEIERGMLHDHLDKCPFKVVECEFSHMGCQEKVRRCDLAQHLSDNGIHHSLLSSKMIYESLQKMMEEKDRQLEEKDKQLLEKETQLAEMAEKLQSTVQLKERQLQEKDKKLNVLLEKLEYLQTVVGKMSIKVCGEVVLSVTMTEFEEKKESTDNWFSPPYFTHFQHGYKMCFEVDFTNDKSLRIDSYMMKGGYDSFLLWPFKGKVIVQLLNQLGDHHHYDYVFDYNDKEQGKKVTRGLRGEYLGTATLPYSRLGYNSSTNCQYLKDDCLQFKVIIPPQ